MPWVTCSDCIGAGYQGIKKCPTCNGHGGKWVEPPKPPEEE